MLQRYLGNKSSLSDEIVRLVQEVTLPGARVCDAFSGSLAVSFALKRAGFQVSSNDINILSWVYATAYLANNTLPEINLKELVGDKRAKKIIADGMLDPSCIDYKNSAWRNVVSLERLCKWAGLIRNIYEPYATNEFPELCYRTDFFTHYCEEGLKSSYLSSRGSCGNRRFLSPSNASALDRAMTRIRAWFRKGAIDENSRCVLTACILDSVEKVANIQGTYHDFPREFYDPRSLKTIIAKLPDPDVLLNGPASSSIGKAMDSLEFIKTVPHHSVLYLDPPYNFRQYTAYYFLPNLIAQYPEIDDLDLYFAQIQFVRGQNMESEFKSTFCSSTKFIPSLQALIESASCEYVVLSYFNGKNHWNDFKSGTDNRGREELESFFSSELFESGTTTLLPIDRLNYQSYGGHKALKVSEYLFVAKKAKPERVVLNKSIGKKSQVICTVN